MYNKYILFLKNYTNNNKLHKNTNRIVRKIKIYIEKNMLRYLFYIHFLKKHFIFSITNQSIRSARTV